jgi:hypothetical protein
MRAARGKRLPAGTQAATTAETAATTTRCQDSSINPSAAASTQAQWLPDRAGLSDRARLSDCRHGPTQCEDPKGGLTKATLGSDAPYGRLHLGGTSETLGPKT